jgi:hypothetical protein
MGGSWLGSSLQRDGALLCAHRTVLLDAAASEARERWQEQQVMGARDQGLQRLDIAPQGPRFKPLRMLNWQGHPGVIPGLKLVSYYDLGIDCPLQ